ncbi:MAG: tetratricopeptide repeat protein [Acidobacteria bacterium]|nr:tetratricopeptide repeat protein [Acidobacteriota bacterium]
MKQFKPVILFAAVLLIVGASVPSGEKELIIRLQGEVIVLQRQIRDLQESFDKWQGQSNASMQKLTENSSTSVRELSTIGETLRNSRTTQSNSMAGTNASLQRITEILSGHRQSFDLVGDQLNSLRQSLKEMQQKQEQLEQKEKMENRETGAASGSPDAIYAAGYASFLKGNHDSAIRQFRDFLREQPQGEDSDDALYWIGESLFAQGRYAEAMAAYDRILSEFSQGDRSQGALLRRGLSLLHLERRDEGIAVLRSVIGQYPQSREAGLAREELRRLGV